MSAKFEAIKPHIGAIVHADRPDLFSDEVARDITARLEDRGVLVFPRVGFNDEEQLRFTEVLGERIHFHRPELSGGAETEIYKVSLDREGREYVLGTFFWHMDGMPVDIPPPKATLLSARRVSAEGGQTEFANTIAAYENLTDDEKKELEGLRVLHTVVASIRPVLEEVPTEGNTGIRAQNKERPLVWTQPSGRKSLLIGSTADRIVAMPLAEGRALLARLLEWAAQREFCYRHEWEDGDLVLWNNCGALHRVLPYDRASGRLMHRTSLAGAEQAD